MAKIIGYTIKKGNDFWGPAGEQRFTGWGIIIQKSAAVGRSNPLEDQIVGYHFSNGWPSDEVLDSICEFIREKVKQRIEHKAIIALSM